MDNDFIGGAAATDKIPPPPAENPATVATPANEVPAGTVEATPVVEAVGAGEKTDAAVDYEAKFNAEVIAHDATKALLRASEAICASAKAMGFRGAGIHSGS